VATTMDNPGQQQNVGESRTAHFADGADVGAQTRPTSNPVASAPKAQSGGVGGNPWQGNRGE
jgi:hypothetical protein